MNYSEINFYFDCNRPQRDLQNNILQLYILIYSIIHNWCQTLPVN